MGYAIHALDPAPDCPAHAVVDRLITAPFDDPDAAAELARHCDVVTLEIEQIAAAGLEAAQRFESALEIDPSNERAARELADMRRQATNERKGLLSRLMGKKEGPP